MPRGGDVKLYKVRETRETQTTQGPETHPWPGRFSEEAPWKGEGGQGGKGALRGD